MTRQHSVHETIRGDSGCGGAKRNYAEAMKQAEAAVRWPETIVRGNLSPAASVAIDKMRRNDEEPWLILTAGAGAGTLVAFEDRLAIIKSGYMVGAVGGERQAVMHFRDITGVEYNSDLFGGVLEILTPSHQGVRSVGYLRGLLARRTAGHNAVNPWTRTNTLPLRRSEHAAVRAELVELTDRIYSSR